MTAFFANLGKIKLKHLKFRETKIFSPFLTTNRFNPGHTLLIPKKHYEYLFDLDEKNYAKILKRAKELSEPLKIAMSAKRIGVIVEGFGVAHVHIHLVRFQKSGELLQKGAVGVTDEEFAKVT